MENTEKNEVIASCYQAKQAQALRRNSLDFHHRATEDTEETTVRGKAQAYTVKAPKGIHHRVHREHREMQMKWRESPGVFAPKTQNTKRKTDLFTTVTSRRSLA